MFAVYRLNNNWHMTEPVERGSRVKLKVTALTGAGLRLYYII